MDTTDEEEVKTIKEAMDDIASKSCIKFRPREGDEHAVIIEVRVHTFFQNNFIRSILSLIPLFITLCNFLKCLLILPDSPIR